MLLMILTQVHAQNLPTIENHKSCIKDPDLNLFILFCSSYVIYTYTTLNTQQRISHWPQSRLKNFIAFYLKMTIFEEIFILMLPILRRHNDSADTHCLQKEICLARNIKKCWNVVLLMLSIRGMRFSLN